MQQVWKFPLSVMPVMQTIKMPKDASVLSVQVQRNQVCLWALCELKDGKPIRTEERHFITVGTGQDAHPNYTYIGTVQLENGYLVLHIFEVVAM